jgi:hypothetical protein
MSDTARLLLTAAVLSVSAFAAFAWRVTRADPSQPERLIGELRLAQWAAVLLAAAGSAAIGFATARASVPLGTIDVTVAVSYVLLSGLVLQREPRSGLLLAAVGFLAHALIDLAHRPGWLSAELMPRWYIAGCAAWDLALSAVCFWARRR